MKHELKLCRQFYDAVARGEKTFEVRKNDRGFKAGDELVLRAVTDDATRAYIADLPALCADVPFILDDPNWGVAEGYVVMAITNVRRV